MRVSIPSLPIYSPIWHEGKLTHGVLMFPFVFWVDGKRYEIPAGFIWDGNSIPRICWSFTGTPWQMELLIAGLVHDFCYRFAIFIRKICDELHNLCAKKYGTSNYNAGKMYYALRAAGWKAWNKHRKRESQG
jgi:hypothetical protein